MKTGLKIRMLRHSAGLDQHQAAEKTGISVAEYSKIETGMVKADDTIFDAITALFSINREQFNLWPEDDNAKDWLQAYLA